MDFLKKLCPQLAVVEWVIVAAIFVIALGVFGVQAHRIDKLKASVATEQADRAAERAAAASAAASAALDRLQESERRITATQEIAREASRIETLHRQDAVSVAAASADRGLRDAFRIAVPSAGRGAGGGDSRPVAVGYAGTATLDLRADVFDQWDGRARILEAALDQAHDRGIACQREYQALRNKQHGASGAPPPAEAGSAP